MSDEKPVNIAPPYKLSEYAREVWDYTLPLIPTIQPKDIETFAAYCRAAAEARETDELLRREGGRSEEAYTVRLGNGSKAEHPLSVIRRKATAAMIDYAKLLDLTPQTPNFPMVEHPLGGLIYQEEAERLGIMDHCK